jgi:subtilase family serine protease
MFFRTALFTVLVIPSLIGSARATDISVSAPQIHSRIDETHQVTLYGGTPPEAQPENDRGRVPDGMSLPGLQLALRRPAAQERLVETLIRDQLDRKSLRYHRWITADEYGWRYGVAIPDVNRIVSWLGLHGFKVNAVSTSRMRIDFSGNAGEVRDAFHTEIHRLHVHGEDHIANMSDPQIPAALAPAIAGIAWLNDFRPKPQYTGGQTCEPFDANGNKTSTCYWVVPADLSTIYNFPVSQWNGAGQRIAVMEDIGPPYGDTDWCNFRILFLEASCSHSLFVEVNPGGCSTPSVYGGAEVALDPQWASAAAPGAHIDVAVCADNGTRLGYVIALQNLVDSNAPPEITSMSYGICEATLGLGGVSLLDSVYQQAAAEGYSSFVAAGDGGAAGCDPWGTGPATQGIAVSGYASSPYVVAVGGTTFGDWALGTETYYWNLQNNQPYWGSALSYIPEIAWNSSCGNVLAAGYYGYTQTYGLGGFCNSSYHNEQFHLNISGSGGPSACAIPAPGDSCAGYPKPSWQSGILGNPGDGVRDVPDVSIFAGGAEWGHELVYCNKYYGLTCTNVATTWGQGSGTSFSAPIFAGIQALINQRVGGPVGNPSPMYYTLAKGEYGQYGNSNCVSRYAVAGNNCVFYDISDLKESQDSTTAVPCMKNQNGNAIDCYLDHQTYGVLSRPDSNYYPAYLSQPGWDFTTGIGSPNVTNLVNAWPIP